MTVGLIFGNGNCCLGAEVCDEVIYRNETEKETEADIVPKKKMKLRELISCLKVIKDKMKDKI